MADGEFLSPTPRERHFARPNQQTHGTAVEYAFGRFGFTNPFTAFTHHVRDDLIQRLTKIILIGIRAAEQYEGAGISFICKILTNSCNKESSDRSNGGKLA